ncbi:MMB_0454 family protein [Mycoplasma yeatsii]|uniref:Asp23/Gls24 family envelope stress response protein n=1 Tax=Mycoplasma yeatsii TaxID=51365 RepID=A0ABU0NEC5_9MOLU|nr:hypothetical protein [Mycoplasma yeatsii]MDQ0567801.1 hypothetical protein [Mycoplasma yeatsii]
MYITIDKNRRGNLEIEQNVVDKLIKSTVISSFDVEAENIDVLTSVFQDNELYILITIKVQKALDTLKINKDKLFKIIDKTISQAISIKPKNINISYTK